MTTRIRIPDDLTTEQAVFLHDFLESLADTVWRQYDRQLNDYWAGIQPDDLFYEDDEAEQQDDLIDL